MKDLSKIKNTINEHLVRNLKWEDDNTISGEVAHKYCDYKWETVTWKRCDLDKNYFVCQLGESWDIYFEDIKYGFIESFDLDEIRCILRKDYELDELLTYNIEDLTFQQEDMVCDGAIIKYDKINDVIKFLEKDGNKWI